jgi:hypothetical protein
MVSKWAAQCIAARIAPVMQAAPKIAANLLNPRRIRHSGLGRCLPLQRQARGDNLQRLREGPLSPMTPIPVSASSGAMPGGKSSSIAPPLRTPASRSCEKISGSPSRRIGAHEVAAGGQ